LIRYKPNNPVLFFYGVIFCSYC